jgi:hypothetical protein
MDKRSSIDCKSCANRRHQKICDMCRYGELFVEKESLRFDDQRESPEYPNDYEIDNDH